MRYCSPGSEQENEAQPSFVVSTRHGPPRTLRPHIVPHPVQLVDVPCLLVDVPCLFVDVPPGVAPCFLAVQWGAGFPPVNPTGRSRWACAPW